MFNFLLIVTSIEEKFKIAQIKKIFNTFFILQDDNNDDDDDYYGDNKSNYYGDNNGLQNIDLSKLDQFPSSDMDWQPVLSRSRRSTDDTAFNSSEIGMVKNKFDVFFF